MTHTRSGTPLDKGSAFHICLVLTSNNTQKRQVTMTRRDSNPQYQHLAASNPRLVRAATGIGQYDLCALNITPDSKIENQARVIVSTMLSNIGTIDELGISAVLSFDSKLMNSSHNATPAKAASVVHSSQPGS
jgi:hypothetical protein